MVIVKDNDAGRDNRVLLALGGVAFGVGIGFLLWGRTAAEPAQEPLAEGPFARASGPPVAPKNELPVLNIRIAADDAAVLQRARQRALQQGVLDQRPGETVGAEVSLGGATARAKVRLKGDWVDHLDSDKWSMRVELEDRPLMGMSRFSIQHPKTRGYALEWLIMEVGRRQGLLVPRARFVNVAVNDRDAGVFYLEEHFTKEMLESQGRRDGPIVRFSEDAMWSTWVQHEFPKTGYVPPSAVSATSVYLAPVAGFGEGRLAAVDALNRRLHRAMGMLRDLQRGLVAELGGLPQLKMQALAELQGRTVDELFVPEKLGRMLAVYSLFQAFHGLAWHQLRFYHDPIEDRLEPILFDTGANPVAAQPQLAVFAPDVLGVVRSARVYEAAFDALGEMIRPEYLDTLQAEIGPELDVYLAAMAADGTLPATLQNDPRVDAWNWLRVQTARIRREVLPAAPVALSARVVGLQPEGEDVVRVVEVDAWALTGVPVHVHGFRFSNGRIVSAADALAEISPGRALPFALEPALRGWRRDDGAVALPRDGRHIRFLFAVDERLARLRSVQAFKNAVRRQLPQDDKIRLRIDAMFRPVAAAEPTVRRLQLRHLDTPGSENRGRPLPPDLGSALEQHPFLLYDLERDRLVVRPGSWDVTGDVVVPAGQSLWIDAGTTLRFSPGSVLVTDAPLYVDGSAAAPVVFEPRDATAGWAGILVLDARPRSRLRHAVIRGAAAIDRGGWQTTGGVTFYRAPVDLLDCRIEDARGEDALNVFGAALRMERCTLDGAVSDMLDADFVTGQVIDCSFARSGEDAVDFSGSRVVVRGCTFQGIGDKAVSVGEDSTAEVRACTVVSASIALAAKDLSRVTVDGLEIEAVENFGLAAYVKKDEYGPSSITARNVRIGTAGRAPHLVQRGCEITVDGERIEAQEIDVQELYRQGVLGK